MRTANIFDETVLTRLDYTTPPVLDLSPTYDREPPEFPWAPAWSSSPLGDPGVDDDLGLVDEYRLEVSAAPTPVAALGAAALAMLGFGVLMGVAADFAASPASPSTVTIAAHAEPAPPKMMMSTATSVTAVPPPASVPATTTLPDPAWGPTFQVLPCDPTPFCV